MTMDEVIAIRVTNGYLGHDDALTVNGIYNVRGTLAIRATSVRIDSDLKKSREPDSSRLPGGITMVESLPENDSTTCGCYVSVSARSHADRAALARSKPRIELCQKHAAVDRLVAALRLLKQVAFDGPPTEMTGTEYAAWKRAADIEAAALLAEIRDGAR